MRNLFRLTVVLLALAFFAPTASSGENTRRILVFGDSNSFGWFTNDADQVDRFPAAVAWPGRMAEALGDGYEVLVEALGGRTTNIDVSPPTGSGIIGGVGMNGAAYLPAALSSHMPLDLVVIMLGTNDLREEFHRAAEDIAHALVELASVVKDGSWQERTGFPIPEVLIISPPKVDNKSTLTAQLFANALRKSEELPIVLEPKAKSVGVHFFDAAAVVPFADQDVAIHLTPANHAVLGSAAAKHVQKILVNTPREGLAAALDSGKPLVLRTMGSLFFGGTIGKNEAGVPFHGDHGYAQYYIPQNARTYPLILWHGVNQSGKTWESTADGREGYQALLARMDWPVYIIDQPRRGRAGRTQAGPGEYRPMVLAGEDRAWQVFRMGLWPYPQPATLFDGIQFDRDAYSIEQFMRQQTPDTGDEPRTAEHRAFMAQSMVDLLEKTGPGILFTHSNSGQYGWTTAMTAPEKVKAIVAYEPAAVVFPAGTDLVKIPSHHPEVVDYPARAVPFEEFKKLTRMPINIVFGDFIPDHPSEVLDIDLWRVALERCRQFVDLVNLHGGDATLTILPEIGIHGNSHFPFADLNNVEVAEHVLDYLHTKNLDGTEPSHTGPAR